MDVSGKIIWTAAMSSEKVLKMVAVVPTGHLLKASPCLRQLKENIVSPTCFSQARNL